MAWVRHDLASKPPPNYLTLWENYALRIWRSLEAFKNLRFELDLEGWAGITTQLIISKVEKSLLSFSTLYFFRLCWPGMDEGPNVKEHRMPNFGLVSSLSPPQSSAEAETETLTATWIPLASDWPGIVGYYCLQKMNVWATMLKSWA